MALAETVCMSITEYYQFSGATVGISMAIGFITGIFASWRWHKRRYSIREFTESDVHIVQAKKT